MVCITSSKLFTTSVLPLMIAVCRGLKNQYKIVGFITFSVLWYNSFLIDRLSDIMYLSQAMKKVKNEQMTTQIFANKRVSIY